MKKIFFVHAFIFITCSSFCQEALKIQSGGSITIQNGAELALQGGLTLENGSSLLNNGTISLKNNSIANISNWSDNSILGALTGTGIVIFNSTNSQQFTGPTSFYTVYINTDQLTINNDFNIYNLLRLIKGKINTSNYVVALVNTAAASLENDVTNTGYANSWINGNFRRSIATSTSSYDFPVGNSIRSNLLKFLNNNLTGPTSLTSSFGPKPGTDAGLNVTENGNTYTAVNNGGVWKLVPNTTATGGNYALHLYFNGFTGLQDNHFGILRRTDASANAADWMLPAGSLLESLNGTGRKLSDGFARRYNISDFSQLGIGEFNLGTPCEITGQSQVCNGSLNNIYSAPAGMTSYFWSVTGAGIAGSNTAPTINITAPNAPGSFTINLTTILNGIQSQCSRTITITPTPSCDIFGAGDLCVLPTSNTYAGPGNMSTYFWSSSPGLQIVGSNTGSSVNVTATLPGPQLLTLNSTWLSGCVSQCSKLINVTPIPPCNIDGESTVTAATTNNTYSGPAGLGSYNWSVTNGTIVGSTTGSSINVTAGVAGTMKLTLTTTLNSCSRTCERTIAVDPVFTYSCNISGASETCNGSTETFTAPANLESYKWNISGNGTIVGSQTNSSVTVESTATGTYTLELETMLNSVPCTSQKTVTVIYCITACTYTQGFYGNPNGLACYNNSGAKADATELMINAFTGISQKVFGNVTNKRFFTLYFTDIVNSNIYNMLPGGGNAKALDIDKKSPFDGAYYDDESTWSLVPMQSNGPQKGKIRNSLLAQTMVLWFNIQNSNTLGSISLVNDTLLTKKTESCGSNTPIGDAIKFGLHHSVIVYLNGGNGYPATVDGLLLLANDVLGGVVSNISASAVNEAMDIINNAFDECRILVGTIPYQSQLITKTQVPVSTSDNFTKETNETNTLKVIAYPNPYKNFFQLQITSPVSGTARIEFFTMIGQKIYEINKPVVANSMVIIPYTGPLRFATLAYKVTIGKNIATGIVLKPD